MSVVAAVRGSMTEVEYDLEMTILQGALKSFKKTQVVVPFPKSFTTDTERNYAALQRAVDRAPSPTDLFHADNLTLDPDIEDLLTFLHTQRCLRQESNAVPEEGLAYQPQFTFSISHPEGDPARVKEYCQTAGKYSTKGGFHGSALGNWFSITKNGLRNFSGTQKQANGALFGEGIYLSKRLGLASDFSAAGEAWGRSELGSAVRIVGVVEWLESPETVTASESKFTDGGKVPEAYVVVPNASHVRLTKLLIYVSGPPPAQTVAKKSRASTYFTSTSMIFLYFLFLVLAVMTQRENQQSLKWAWRNVKNKVYYASRSVV